MANRFGDGSSVPCDFLGHASATLESALIFHVTCLSLAHIPDINTSPPKPLALNRNRLGTIHATRSPRTRKSTTPSSYHQVIAFLLDRRHGVRL